MECGRSRSHNLLRKDAPRFSIAQHLCAPLSNDSHDGQEQVGARRQRALQKCLREQRDT